ncbi:chromate efflux transporter [Leucobacter sp. 7(1)]|uniref:chromate efflux transporter n=1 Tax=Leucobacter sp. 7(1) TaxID=1255613 RepID=UPI000B35E8F3|nr:chromate efflux transporter [Leucobacter sp. 7(1)]
MPHQPPATPPNATWAAAWEVFRVFGKLGLTSFGGPVAHLGYFRTEITERRRWLTDAQLANLVAVCQFLPGPTSSQVGFGIGLHRAGLRGALAAFLAFTLPSAVLMFTFALGADRWQSPLGAGVLAGLQVVAVAVIAHAVLGMARTLTPDVRRALIAIAAGLAALLIGGTLGPVAGIALGAFGGTVWCRGVPATRSAPLHFTVSRRTGLACLAVFAVFLLGGPLLALALPHSGLPLFDTMFRAGALVFGGGHVVLPLLESGIVATGDLNAETFLAGYGAAQAVPGPLFTFAAYLGALSDLGPGGILGAGIALCGIFLPGFLLLLGVLPFWKSLQARAWAPALMHGANAGVVGVLTTALITPAITSTITGPWQLALALGCFALLTWARQPAWLIVCVGAGGGLLAALSGLG